LSVTICLAASEVISPGELQMLASTETVLASPEDESRALSSCANDAGG
jgi:hypothetical protein